MGCSLNHSQMIEAIVYDIFNETILINILHLYAIALESPVFWFRQYLMVYKNMRVSLHHTAICFKQHVVIIEHQTRFRHVVTAYKCYNHSPQMLLIMSSNYDIEQKFKQLCKFGWFKSIN